ncbi:MAG: hypothetical protein AAF490_08205 [Chloroflexota bacterium]
MTNENKPQISDAVLLAFLEGDVSAEIANRIENQAPLLFRAHELAYQERRLAMWLMPKNHEGLEYPKVSQLGRIKLILAEKLNGLINNNGLPPRSSSKHPQKGLAWRGSSPLNNDKGRQNITLYQASDYTLLLQCCKSQENHKYNVTISAPNIDLFTSATLWLNSQPLKSVNASDDEFIFENLLSHHYLLSLRSETVCIVLPDLKIPR